ncbi:hypothetical protein GPECTOR_11g166 [Gonium pectorale]|uniref:Uncharacterized protein n=1 Tax=Gonium pectorale TaxID=33097 RepID=A0A150GPQ9_GONPE|nr:hypothetical protein GPECTOR_11g166 [Gonium pectorale]|eukprot:KXZ51718.1 hypothetical protein GPECTOR_11g166 [Gonium pectorale]
MALPLHPVTPGFDPRLRNLADRKIASNVFLQQLLYYRIFFNLAWLGFWMVFIFRNYWRGLKLKDNDIVRTIFFIFWFIAEPVRMLAGWYGNLQENVPWLMMFSILSLIPEQGTVLYLLMGAGRRNAMTKAVQWVMLVLQELELITGIYTVFVMYKKQKRQFYLFEYVMNQRVREGRPPIPSSGIGSGGVLPAR